MNRKPLVLVVCGAGTLTSVIASQEWNRLEERGITDVEIKVGRLDDIDGTLIVLPCLSLP
ncbi:MAG: hypothetical protein ACLRL6_12630 [Clostridium sp.]